MHTKLDGSKTKKKKKKETKTKWQFSMARPLCSLAWHT